MQLLKGQATLEQIQEWKEKYGKIFTYTVDEKICYFRPVNRNDYSLAASKVTSAGPAKFNEILIANTWLGGCDELRKEDKYFFGLIDKIEELMDKQKGELGEL
jgi:hypothetical protein